MELMEQRSALAALQDLSASGNFYQGPQSGGRSCRGYISPDQFQLEQDRLIRSRPFAAAHSSELPVPGSYKACNILGIPTLLARGRDGRVRAFRNACRHRGMRLVPEGSGCAGRFTCPYHAWTYDDTGSFVTGPHFQEGFPDLLASDLQLHTLICEERWGFVWVVLKGDTLLNPLASLEPIGRDLDWLAASELGIVAATDLDIKANWKLLVEGGLEAYHFRVAHRSTIGPYFEDNLSSYSTLGDNIRSVLPRRSLRGLDLAKMETGVIRQYANILYTLMPTCQLLVQQDHIVWINAMPLAPNRTLLRLVTLASATSAGQEYWDKNHDITLATLGEDFAIAEGIQGNLDGGLEQTLHFGRYESGLGVFNSLVESALK